jgi:hypothetical protein
MPLSQFQINEFTKRAKMAGLSDDQIQLEIQKKAREMSGIANNIQAAPQTRQFNPSLNTNNNFTKDIAGPEDNGFVFNLVKGFAQNAIDYTKFVGEALNQTRRFAFDPVFRKSVMGEELTSEEAKKLAEENPTAFYSKEEGEKKLGDRGKIVLTGAKATAGMESYFIPFGKGANIATKAFIPGAITGALNEFSREDSTPISIIEAAATGATTAGALHAVGGMLSWAKNKGGELIRESEMLTEGTRQIKVKASVFGAKVEKAINETLNKYGFKGTAQMQYEKLEPVMKEIEEKIQTLIKDNPDLAVSKESIRESFIDNLKSSLRTKDLTQKQAIAEIEGYLTDLLRAAGDVGAEKGQPLLKGGAKDIPLAMLREMKKILNQDYASVFKKLENNTSLNAREKVIAAAWGSLDDAVKNLSPELKQLLLDESNLYKAAQPLSSARFNAPTLRGFGTSLPARVTQFLRDIGSNTLKKLGIGVEKLPNGAILQQPILEKLAVMTPIMLKQRGLTDDEIKQVEDFKSTIQPSGTGIEDDITAPLNTNNSSSGLINNKNLQPTALNPFGGLNKKQVLALALSNGATATDLENVGKIYDMLADDNGVVSGETQKVADNLRQEYFTRTKENKFIDVLNAYQKVTNTTDTPAGDVSMIFAFMKMLDPTSVVREGEFATAEQTAGIPEQIVQQYNRALSGKRLTNNQRKAYQNEATRVFQVYQQRQAPIDAYYQGLAQRYGIDPSLLGVGLYR